MEPKNHGILCRACCILAAASLLYGILVRSVGSGTNFFLFWLGLAGGFLLGAEVLRRGIWGRLPASARRWIAGLLCAAVCVFAVTEGIILSGFHRSGEPDLDYIIVLGAQIYEEGPSVVLRYRLDRAIGYLNENPGTICVVSGGQGSNEPYPEADGMAEYLIRHGIPECRILRERESLNTMENMRFSRTMIPADASVGLVTNDFHMYRALLMAKEEGIAPVCGITAPSVPLYLPNNMAREFFALGKHLLLHVV